MVCRCCDYGCSAVCGALGRDDFAHLLEVDGTWNDLRADDQPRRTGNLQRLRGGPRAVDDRSCYRAVHVGLQPVDISASGLRRIDDAVHRDRPARRHHRGMEIGEHTLCLGGDAGLCCENRCLAEDREFLHHG